MNKNTVQISHECPIGLLNTIQKYCNYEYALVHLFETHRQYYKFMRNSIKAGRHVILDNSIFELGEAFDWDRYVYWIKKLEPTEYIIPDKLEDCEGTINQANRWFTNFIEKLPNHCKTIGAIQGKTFKELVECYKFMSCRVDKIAISFDYSYYLTTSLGDNKWEQFCNGRKELIDKLIFNGIWNFSTPHHLLGCSLPQEFKYNWNYLNIQTLDTSNPVQQALLGFKYNGTSGLQTKESSKLVDSTFDQRQFTKDELDLIEYNCKQFRKIINWQYE